MVVRYEGNDQTKTPDLELADQFTQSKNPKLGKLCTLYQWHFDDPVSSFERKRNNTIYEWQGNRNPFIDHPEYVKSIWGDQCQAEDEEVEDIEPTDQEVIQAIISILEEKGVMGKEDIFNKVKEMRK